MQQKSSMEMFEKLSYKCFDKCVSVGSWNGVFSCILLLIDMDPTSCIVATTALYPYFSMLHFTMTTISSFFPYAQIMRTKHMEDSESKCMNICGEKYMKVMQRVGFRLAEFQQQNPDLGPGVGPSGGLTK